MVTDTGLQDIFVTRQHLAFDPQIFPLRLKPRAPPLFQNYHKLTAPKPTTEDTTNSTPYTSRHKMMMVAAPRRAPPRGRSARATSRPRPGVRRRRRTPRSPPLTGPRRARRRRRRRVRVVLTSFRPRGTHRSCPGRRGGRGGAGGCRASGARARPRRPGASSCSSPEHTR